MPEPAGSRRAPLRVLILGWHGSTERHLRPLARWYSDRGHVARIVLTPTFDVMRSARGWPRFGESLARSIADEHAHDPRPILVHAFSNTGFWTFSSLLDAAHARHPELLDALDRTILDSAPGFPERIRWWFAAKFSALAMTPSVVSLLRLPPMRARRGSTFHPLVSPPLAVFMAGWQLVARRQTRFMEAAPSHVRAHHRGKPLLAIYGAADELVPVRYVERFLERAETEGVLVERLRFEDGTHVRHFVEHRRDYLDALTRFSNERKGP